MPHRWAFEAIGTRWSLTTASPVPPATPGRSAAVVDATARPWARFRVDSRAAAPAATGGPLDLGPTAPPLLALLERLRVLTGGAMDPFVASSLEHLGYGADVGLRARPGYRPADPARATVRGTAVRIDPPALLDVGGSSGVYAAAELAHDGYEERVVDASGDAIVAGPPVRVALEHPFDPTAAIGVVTLRNRAIAGSAANRRDWSVDGRRLHHVLDARTGRPVETVAATWAIAASGMLADALATALFLVPPEALGDFDFEWVRMRTDGVVTVSADLPGELFT